MRFMLKALVNQNLQNKNRKLKKKINENTSAQQSTEVRLWNKQNGCGPVYISGERNVTGARGGQSVKMGPVKFWVGGASGGDDGYSR
jgi:hypothetical protein